MNVVGLQSKKLGEETYGKSEGLTFSCMSVVCIRKAIARFDARWLCKMMSGHGRGASSEPRDKRLEGLNIWMRVRVFHPGVPKG